MKRTTWHACTLVLVCACACGEKREAPAPVPQELIDLRAADSKSLTDYDVVNQDAGVYQVPVSAAIEMVAANPKLLEPLVELPDLDEMTPLQRGQYLFANTYSCAGCHALDGTVKKAPHLNGRWREPPSELATGPSVPFDDAYFNESVLYSQAKIVKGFQPIMPLFAGRLPEKDLNAIRAYLKSL